MVFESSVKGKVKHVTIRHGLTCVNSSGLTVNRPNYLQRNQR